MEAKNFIPELYREIDWLQSVIEQAIGANLSLEGREKYRAEIEAPILADDDSPYAAIVEKWGLSTYCRLAVALAMAPHIRPQALDVFFGKNQAYDRGFTEFGGVTDKNHSGFLPTGQTLCFLITAANPELWATVANLLGSDSILVKEGIIVLGETEAYLPRLNGIISINRSWLNYFATGRHIDAEDSTAFPARKITTPMEWADLVLNDLVMEQVAEISAWSKHRQTLMKEWELDKKLKPACRALFYGPPGTGKTLAATLIGKASGLDVYKVALPMFLSGYSGQTEKNLSGFLDNAQRKNWILFFDMADALFGERAGGNVPDRYGNIETGYLLQRLEEYPGIVILATNLLQNIDSFFLRRFHFIVEFPLPSANERYQLWRNAFSGTCTVEPAVNLQKIATDYELTGGSIINILRHSALAAVRRNSTVVTQQELMSGIKNELKKEDAMPTPLVRV